MPQERQVGADFLLSLRAGLDLSHATESDSLEDTVSYAALYDIACREMQQPSALVEHAAGRVAAAIFRTYPQIATLDVRLTKLNPPMGAESQGAGVELHYRNNE